MAAALVLLVLGEHGLATWRLGEQVRTQETRNVTRFQQLFPGETRIVDLGAQAEQQYQLAQQAQRGGGLLALTSSLEQALRQVEGLTLQGLQYREGAVFASLTGNALTQLEALRGQGMALTGPLPADTAFQPDLLAQHDAVLAMYHDQGLPVLKYAGFGEAINITLGLPFIRTSVDHGTAFDLAGTGTAKAGSLIAATRLALELAAT